MNTTQTLASAQAGSAPSIPFKKGSDLVKQTHQNPTFWKNTNLGMGDAKDYQPAIPDAVFNYSVFVLINPGNASFASRTYFTGLWSLMISFFIRSGGDYCLIYKNPTTSLVIHHTN